MKQRILLVDDDAAVRLTIKAVLELHGFEVDTAESSAQAIQNLQASCYELVITDIRMETDDAGRKVVEEAERQTYRPAIAILSAFPLDQTQPGMGAVLVKPVGTQALVDRVKGLLGEHHQRRD